LATLLVPIGTQWAVAANGASFVFLWIAIMFCKRRFQPVTHNWTSFRGELVAGVRALRRSSGCMAAVLTICVISLTANPFIGIIPATSRALVTRNGGVVTDAAVSSIVGRLLSAQGVGAILGSLLVASLLRRYKPSIVISTALTSLAAFAALHQYAPNWLLTAMCIFVLGSSMAVLQSVLGTVVQRDASALHRGRILSWYQGLNGLCYGIGLLIMGWTADSYGLRPTFIAAGLALAVFVVLARRSDAWADAMDGEFSAVPEPVVVAALS
jgi:predicted MFS family arabinose efflux permease